MNLPRNWYKYICGVCSLIVLVVVLCVVADRYVTTNTACEVGEMVVLHPRFPFGEYTLAVEKEGYERFVSGRVALLIRLPKRDPNDGSIRRRADADIERNLPANISISDGKEVMILAVEGNGLRRKLLVRLSEDTRARVAAYRVSLERVSATSVTRPNHG